MKYIYNVTNRQDFCNYYTKKKKKNFMVHV